jgi:hypothetical protein
MLKNWDITRAVLRGAVQASREYMKWTGGYTVHDHGVEAVVSRGVAAALFKGAEDAYIALELSFDDLKKYSYKHIRRGRPRREFAGRPRMDVSLFNSAGVAIAVVEVKRQIAFSSSITDLRRISSVLHELSRARGSIKIGCVVGIRERLYKQRKPIKSFISEFSKKVEAKFPTLRCRGVSKGFTIPRRYQDDPAFAETAGYQAVCFQIRLRNRRR